MTSQHSHDDSKILPVSLTVFAALTGGALCWIWSSLEGSNLPLIPLILFAGFVFAGREFPLSWKVTGYALASMSFVLVFVAADLFLHLTHRPLLFERYNQLSVFLEYQEQIESSFESNTCPRWFLKESEGDDERGWRYRTVGEGEQKTILILGDSVTFGGVAYQIHEGYRKAKIPIRIIDTSVPGYSSIDEECVLDLALTMEKPDLVVIGVCLNDFTDAVDLRMDIGGGTHDYFWGAVYNEQIEKLGKVPLLVEPTNTWLKYNEEALKEMGQKLMVGFNDGEAFFDAVRKLGNLNPNLSALVQMHQKLVEADIASTFVLFPVNYHVSPNPTVGLYRHVQETLEGVGANVVDLYSLFDPMSAQELQPVGQSYDVIHYNEPAMALAAHEALRVSKGIQGTPEMEKVLEAIRKEIASTYARPRMKEALLKAIAN